MIYLGHATLAKHGLAVDAEWNVAFIHTSRGYFFGTRIEVDSLPGVGLYWWSSVPGRPR